MVISIFKGLSNFSESEYNFFQLTVPIAVFGSLPKKIFSPIESSSINLEVWPSFFILPITNKDISGNSLANANKDFNV